MININEIETKKIFENFINGNEDYLILNDYKFIKQKYKNIYVIYYQDFYYKEPFLNFRNSFNYMGFYCPKNNEFYDVSYKFNDSIHKIKRIIDLKNDMFRKIKEFTTDFVLNSKTYFKNNEPFNARDCDLLDVMHDVFYNKLKTFNDFIILATTDINKEHGFNFDDVLDYLNNPDEFIKKAANTFLNDKKDYLCNCYERYMCYVAAYDKIKNDRKHYFHKMLAIKKAVEIENAKTINVAIKKDNEPFSFKTTSREFLRFEPYHNETFFINNDDKINYTRLFGHENYHITDILRITYRGKEIYNRNNII